MKRPIKFRAWDIKNERFVNIVRLIPDQFGELDYADVVYNGKIYKLYQSEVVLEQDTGLKDKNGEEISEGDIVLDYYDGDDAFIVAWDKDTASLRLTGTDNIVSASFDNFYSDKDLEVIGNIHENPELLCEKTLDKA